MAVKGVEVTDGLWVIFHPDRFCEINMAGDNWDVESVDIKHFPPEVHPAIGYVDLGGLTIQIRAQTNGVVIFDPEDGTPKESE